MKKEIMALTMGLALMLGCASTAFGADADSLVVSDNGNVGVGTTAPRTNLEVFSGENTELGIVGNRDNSYVASGLTLGDNLEVKRYLFSLRGTLTNNNSDFRMYYHTTNPSRWLMTFGIHPTAPDSPDYKMSLHDFDLNIDENGNVGIGTNTPQAKLHVKGGGILFDSGFGGSAVNYTYGSRSYRYVFEGNAYNMLIRGNNSCPIMGIDRINGSVDAPQTLADGDEIFNMRTSGTNANGTQTYHSLLISSVDGASQGDQLVQRLELLDKKVIIRGSGKVGIGLSDPQAKLHVAGNVLADAYNNPSDIRWKENVEPIGDALELVSQLRGVSFDWTDPSHGTGPQIGVIAQEVEQVLPEVVHTDSQGVQIRGVRQAGGAAHRGGQNPQGEK